MSVALEVNNLCKKYSSGKGINNINFTLEQGKVLTIIGKSKSGKSSIVKSITGIISPSSGDIKILSSSDLEVARKQVGTMIEFPVLYIGFTAKENLELHRRMIGEKDKLCVDKLLSEVKLSKVTKPVKQFSQQLRERMGIAMALMGNPPLVILDEPFDEMDNEAVTEISSLLLSYKQKYGTSFLITSQTLRGLNELTDKFIVIDSGEIVEESAELNNIDCIDSEVICDE